MSADDLARLAGLVAEWSKPAPGMVVYLYGSRVRGDHRPDSDLDVYVDIRPASTHDDAIWWTENNASQFAALRAAVPHTVEVLDPDHGLRSAILAAPVVHSVCNVRCVWLPPKPGSE